MHLKAVTHQKLSKLPTRADQPADIRGVWSQPIPALKILTSHGVGATMPNLAGSITLVFLDITAA
jgi:hypothetical protein